MDFTTYAPLARRTLKELTTLREHLIHMSLGLIGEYGELIDALKKFVVYGMGVDPSGARDAQGKPVPMKIVDGGVPDLTNRTEEIGDVAWYLVNLCPELGVVDLTALDAAFVEGYADDQWANKGLFEQAATLITLATGTASMCFELLEPECSKDQAQELVLFICKALGGTCALLGVNISDALERNVAKLAKRYGDKYSDYMALNRDLSAERTVLEGTASVGLTGVGTTAVSGTLKP